jgi:uncharacterized membrane protein
MSRVWQWWLALRSSLWFVPSLLVAFAVNLAAALVHVETLLPDEGIPRLARLLTNSADGARAMLAAVAGSMITVAGVVFSITIVTLSLASSQYSPRVLRGFMKDPTNQVVLGVFVGIFAYCIVVLGAIRTDQVQFVPSLAVLVGAILSLVGIGFLIHFIHHTALAIQASNIVANVTDETLDAIERLYAGDTPDEERTATALPDEWTPVRAERTGYVQRTDAEALVDLAAAHDVVIRTEVRAGDFVVAGSPLASVSGSRGPGRRFVRTLHRAFVIDRQRTVEQDPAWGIQQIVDVAAKAISPGINDSTTAVTCIEYLVPLVTRLARCRFPPAHRYRAGQVRLVLPGRGLRELVSLAFDEIRHWAGGNPAVLRQLLAALEQLASTGADVPDANLSGHLHATVETIERTIESPHERRQLLDHSASVRARLAGPGS